MQDYIIIDKYCGGELPDATTVIIRDFHDSEKAIIDALQKAGFVECSNFATRIATGKYAIDYERTCKSIKRIRLKDKKFVPIRILEPFVNIYAEDKEIIEMIETAKKHGVGLTNGFAKPLKEIIKKALPNADDMLFGVGLKKYRRYVTYKQAHITGISYLITSPSIYKNVTAIDCNGMYLSILKGKLPTGKKIFVVGNKEYHENINGKFAIAKCELIVTGVKKIDILPLATMGIKYGQKCEIAITNIDLEILKEYYNVEFINIIYAYIWEFENSVFAEQCEQWEKMRKSENESERIIGKAMPNVLIGILAQVPTAWKYNSDKKPKRLNKSAQPSPRGVWVGAYITAKGRQIICDAIRGRESDILRIATDGLHFVGNVINTTYGKELGQFKIEGTYKKVMYANRAIRFMESENGEITGKCCGVPSGQKDVMIEKIKQGLTFEEIQRRLTE